MINGKIIDFGGLILHNCSDLSDPKIRRIIRVILKHVNYQFDNNIFEAKWEISSKNYNSLRNYVLKKAVREDYLKALDIIKSDFPRMPIEVFEVLENINEVDSCSIKKYDRLMPKTIITPKLDDLLCNMEYYNIKLKTISEPSYDFPGNAIIDLNNNKIGVYFFNKDRVIKEIKFQECVNGKFCMLLNLKDQEIQDCAIEDFSMVLG